MARNIEKARVAQKVEAVERALRVFRAHKGGARTLAALVEETKLHEDTVRSWTRALGLELADERYFVVPAEVDRFMEARI